MIKNIIFVGFIVILLVFSGCTNTTNNENNLGTIKDKFIGTWTEEDSLENAVYIFSSDGTCSISI